MTNQQIRDFYSMPDSYQRNVIDINFKHQRRYFRGVLEELDRDRLTRSREDVETELSVLKSLYRPGPGLRSSALRARIFWLMLLLSE